MAHRTEPVNVLTSLVFIVTALALFGFVLATIFYFQYARDRMAASAATASSPDALRALRTREEETLTRYAYVDKEKGIVRIPIERAMELEASRPWHANPAEFPITAPAPTPAATPASTPAPVANVTPASTPTPPAQ